MAANFYIGDEGVAEAMQAWIAELDSYEAHIGALVQRLQEPCKLGADPEHTPELGEVSVEALVPCEVCKDYESDDQAAFRLLWLLGWLQWLWCS